MIAAAAITIIIWNLEILVAFFIGEDAGAETYLILVVLVVISLLALRECLLLIKIKKQGFNSAAAVSENGKEEKFDGILVFKDYSIKNASSEKKKSNADAPIDNEATIQNKEKQTNNIQNTERITSLDEGLIVKKIKNPSTAPSPKLWNVCDKASESKKKGTKTKRPTFAKATEGKKRKLKLRSPELLSNLEAVYQSKTITN